MSELSDRLVFGCCSLSANKTKKKALEILRFARSLGLRYFDTAPLYSRGYSELLLGKAFRDDIEVNIMNKIGKYYIPKTIMPSSFALPLNFLKKTLLSKNNNNNIYKKEEFLLDIDYETHFKNQIFTSNKKLNGINIDGILFHEINPYKLDLKLIESITRYLNSLNIKRLGYAGKMPKEFLQDSLPGWMRIIQLEIPLDLSKKDKNKFFKLIEKHPEKEFRFFNIFKPGFDINKRMNEAKDILREFKNTKIIFQTTSFKRLKANFEFFIK